MSNRNLINVNKGMFHHIVTACQGGSGVLVELGSGETSAHFVDVGLTVYSIEHDEEWIGKYKGVNYIYAPLVPIIVTDFEYFKKMDCKPEWYDIDKIVDQLPREYDALLLDGPQRKYRVNFWYNAHLFRCDVPWFADDMNRPEWFRALYWTCRDRGMDTFPEINGIDTKHAWTKIPPQPRAERRTYAR